MKLKSVLMLGLFLVGLLAVSGIATAVPLNVEWVKINGDEVNPSGPNNLERFDKGDTIDVKVKIRSTADVDDVQIRAWIDGHDHDDVVSASSSVFDLKNGSGATKTLTLELPFRMDQDKYKLRVHTADRNDAGSLLTYDLDVDTARHQVAIKDVILSPSNGVVAGRALLATVRVQNYGEDDEDDVRVTFSIPELNKDAADYIDNLDGDGQDDDQKSTEELYIRIPECTRAGTYDAEVVVEFNDFDRTVRETLTVEVLEGENCNQGAPSHDDKPKAGKTIISVGPESQDVAAGSSVIYPVTITNTGEARTYSIGVTGGDWGSFSVSPLNVVTVSEDDTETLYVRVAANDDATAGPQVFGVSIQAGDKVVKDVTLSANVVAGKSGQTDNLKQALQIGLIVLVIILVILALIIGFNKLKGDDDDDKDNGQSYY